MKPTAEQTKAFQSMYDHFNRLLFDGSLSPVLLNFSRRTRMRGFFAARRWRGSSGASDEISLNPQYMGKRDPRDVASTLVHEMVHAWQHEHGSPSRPGYHNAEWAQKMESVGLMPSSTAAPGGDRLGQRMSHYVIDGGAFARAFARMPESYWFPWVSTETPDRRARRERSARSKTRYSCPGCGANVWGKPALRIRCGTCRRAFLERA